VSASLSQPTYSHEWCDTPQVPYVSSSHALLYGNLQVIYLLVNFSVRQQQQITPEQKNPPRRSSFPSHFECTWNSTHHIDSDLSASNSSWTSTLLPHTYLHSQSAASILLPLHDWLQNFRPTTSQQPTLFCHCQSGCQFDMQTISFHTSLNALPTSNFTSHMFQHSRKNTHHTGTLICRLLIATELPPCYHMLTYTANQQPVFYCHCVIGFRISH